MFIVCMLSISTEVSAASLFAFETTTPEGSWVVSEVTTTDHKGKQTVMITRQKFLGSEQRGGQTYYWLETEMDSFKVKKGKRKADGDQVVMKVLVSKEAMNSDPANVINNMQGFGKEIIMQTGDSQPMRISDGGMLAGSMMKSMGVEVNYQFEEEGTETVETNAGQFKAKRIKGSGSTSSKILFKKIEVQSKSMMWISEKVPFGVVKSENTDLVNGKEQHSQRVLIEFGRSGAVTAITGDVMEMPF
jgi:hypothetical protein